MNYRHLNYGFFVHYIAPGAIYPDGKKTQTVNEAADRFNVASFVEDIEIMKVEYIIFTAWHYQMRPLYPSKVMEKWRPGNCAKRDLVGEIIAALKLKGIQVILYTHPRDGHDLNDKDRIATGWGEGFLPNNPDTPNPETFEYKKWNHYIEELYEELFTNYRSSIDGVFIDGMGPGRYIYPWPGSIPYDFPIVDYHKICHIAKKYDQNLPVIQNYFGDLFTNDYAMQEAYWGFEASHTTVEEWPVCQKALAFTPFSSWAAEKPTGISVVKMDPDEIARFTIFNATCHIGGGTCWASGPYVGGGWEDGVMKTMTVVGAHMHRLSEGIKGVVPSESYPTISGDTLRSKKFLFSCSSIDQNNEYIHILKMTEDNIVKFMPPADHAIFSNPTCISGNMTILDFIQNESGLRIQLKGTPDDLETIVRLDREVKTVAQKHEWINNTDKRIHYQGHWVYCHLHGTFDGSSCCLEHHGCFEFDATRSQQKGDNLFIAFQGTCVEIYGVNDPKGGTADILIDNIKVGQINQYSRNRKTRVLNYSSDTYYPGYHTLRIVITSYDMFELDALKITIN